MISCCDQETFEITFTGIESRTFVEENNALVEFGQQDLIDKEDLVIAVDLLETQVLISEVRFQKKQSDVQVAQAAVVPCADPEITYANRLQSIIVEVIDVENGNTRIDVSDQILVRGFNQSLTEFITLNGLGISDFELIFSDTTNIPNRIEYVVEATFEDNSVFSVTGGIINFN